MDLALREQRSHGTKEYPYGQYRIRTVPAHFHFPVHWHEEMEWIYVRNGCLLVSAAGTDYMLTPGQMLVINPRQLHLMHTEDTQVCYDTLLFPLELIGFQSPDLLEETVFHPLRTGQKRLPNPVPDAVLTRDNRDRLDRIIRINLEKPELYQLETRVLLLQLLLEILRHTDLLDSPEDHSNQLGRQILSYIQMHYTSRIALSDLSDRFHLSPKYLSRFFKENFHITISDYVSHLRMTQAKELLANSTLSITEVAAQCGFSGVSFFIRQFTRENGCSPGKWRKLRQSTTPSPHKQTL